jgi:hypothetical protein
LINLKNNRVLQHLHGQISDLSRHGSGKEQVLTTGWKGSEDLADVWEETHVEHLIGFIEHDMLHGVEGYRSLSHVIKKSARAADHHVHTLLQVSDLNHHARSAVNGRAFDPERAAELYDNFIHLIGKFSGRHHNQQAEGTLRGSEMMHEGEDVSCCLAASCPGEAHKVATAQHRWKSLQLNRGRGGVPRLLDRLSDLGVKFKRREKDRLVRRWISH